MRTRSLEPGEVAWLVALPCALATILAILVLGPPLGRALLGSGSEAFWPSAYIRPEPVEHARFAIAVLGAPFLAAAIVASVRGGVRVPVAGALVTASQALACALLALCLLAQNDLVLSSHRPEIWTDRIFTWRTLAVAAALAGLLVAAPRRPGIPVRVARWSRERPSRRAACLAVALLATAIGFLQAVSTEATVGNAPGYNLIPWDMSETFAVLDGRTPLVDFHAQYAQLWPYLAAAVLALAGSSVLVWTTVMAVCSGLAALAIYAVFRRIAGSSLLALALYLPFLAATLFRQDIIAGAHIFSLWPLRYGGPFLLAWLAARHIGGVAPRRAWQLFVAAGLVLLNNAEFGAAAFLATVAALVCVRPLSVRAAGRLLRDAAIGLMAAGALVSALTLARAGRLPDVSLLFEFSRIYGIGGWVLEPMTAIGLHVALYLTFVAAIAVATVRALRGDEERVLTGMLAWSGGFGLVAGGYYAGRSDPLSLVSLLSPWAFALMLLVVVAVRSLAARSWRRPTPAELVVLFGFGLAVCSLPQLPTPWSQLARLRHDRTPTLVYKQPEALRFVERRTERGEKVAIFIPLGHRIAYDLGLANVLPYAGAESMPTMQQMDSALAAIRREHVHKVFLGNDSISTEEIAALQAAGFAWEEHRGHLYELLDAPPPGQ